jgi:hypothetical protein
LDEVLEHPVGLAGREVAEDETLELVARGVLDTCSCA